MELLSNPTTAYLLSPSLESLHAESMAWKEEIEFWNEEMVFFYKLIHLREPHNGFPSQALADLEKELLRITSDRLGELKSALQNHEQALSLIIKNTLAADDQEYRRHHVNLREEIAGLRNVIRNFKRSAFSFL